MALVPQHHQSVRVALCPQLLQHDALLVQLNQAFKLEVPGLAVPFEFRGRVGVPPAIAACPVR